MPVSLKSRPKYRQECVIEPRQVSFTKTPLSCFWRYQLASLADFYWKRPAARLLAAPVARTCRNGWTEVTTAWEVAAAWVEEVAAACEEEGMNGWTEVTPVGAGWVAA